MSNKKRAFIVIFVIVLTITACAAAASQQQAVSDSHQEGLFQFLGIIGEGGGYSVYRMTDGDNVCYIVLNEYNANFSSSDSAPAIYCP